ncbi:MAG: hypothetical protein M1476_04060 [Candidatus Thermoplasmatota archaeon]|nr:hypothetical protein [Candidatus Thermoplasmatota archaeon]
MPSSILQAEIMEIALSLAVVLLLVFLVPAASGYRKAVLSSVFLLAVILSVIFGYLDVNLYPASNAIVLTYGLTGGVVLSKLLRHKWAYYVIILSVFAFLDMLSFLSGAQGGMPSGSVDLYINLVYFLHGLHVIIGGGDIVFVSAIMNYFLEEHMKKKGLFLISFVAMILLPLAISIPVLILYSYQDGYPLLLSILATFILFRAIQGKPLNHVRKD